ncbi:translation elongation factor Ts [Buchnera aphidicola]|uniref:translation elongation factor Ts n=1 Tax=Buchnera aphidicola TaxID=9 RepID=UPI0031B8643F
MKKIDINLILKLRKKTGSSLIECKKSLIKSNGNVEKALDYLRTTGICTAIRHSMNKSKIGKIFLYCDHITSVLVQLNAETDFVIKNSLFSDLGNKIAQYAVKNKIFEIKELRKIFNKKIIFLINQTKENIVLNKIEHLQGQYISAYLHAGRIGVLLKWNAEFNVTNLELGKKIAMHIAASNPLYLSQETIPKEILKKEYDIQMKLAKKTGKSSFVLEKIVQGRIKKFQNNYTLLEQNFIFDSNNTVKKFLYDKNFIIKKFIFFSLKDE